jgi:NAD(P)-dependent dehydrogenase (short-subunit alcohol dehydrogenase family)
VRRLKVQVNVAVLDAGRHLKAFVRMDGALLGSIDVAIAKAYRRFAGDDERGGLGPVQTGGPAPGLERSNGGLVTFAGEVPLRSSDNRVIGSVGVSGGTVAEDRTIAQAAAAAAPTAVRGEAQLINSQEGMLDFDVLWNNAGIGESGPVSKIPLGLVRHNYEVNVFRPFELTQKVVRKWIDEGKPGKVVFTSSTGGLQTFPGFGIYASTKHALEAIAEAMQGELRPFNIKVQTINPGANATGFNETMADTAFRWLDDARNFAKRPTQRETFDSLLATPEGRLDPREMIDRMIEVVPADDGKFRNVCPDSIEDALKAGQLSAWENRI